MIGLLQRVSEARVVVEGAVVGEITRGLLVLIGVEAGDSEKEADRLLDRLLGYRVFADDAGKMNLGSSRNTVGDFRHLFNALSIMVEHKHAPRLARCRVIHRCAPARPTRRQARTGG